MFSNPEDDEFFNPTSSSNLASLFGTNMTPKQDAAASLIYTPPKQPKPSGQETPKASPKSIPQSAVICSKVVDVFKLVDKSHTRQGKCGLAIIGSESLKAYDIILYKSKQDIITRSKLKPEFLFTVQNNNFAYFCDDQKQQWSVHFENAREIEEFVEKIKTYYAKVVYNKTDDSCDTSQSTPSASKPKVEETVSVESEKKDKDSDSTSDTSTNQTRANLLSRMAKMGQSILPVNIPGKSSGHSDSETDEHMQNRKLVKKKQKFVMVNGEYVPSDKIKHNNQTLNTQPAPVPEYVMLNGQVVPVSALNPTLPAPFPNPLHTQCIRSIPNQIMLGQPQVSPMSDSLHVFIAENRTHNCEVRMNIAQLSSKLDQVLSAIGKSGQTSAGETPEVSDLQLKISQKIKELKDSEIIINSFQEQQQKLQEASRNDEEIINSLKQQNQEQTGVILEQEETIKQLQMQKSVLEEETVQNKTLRDDFQEAQLTINSLRKTVADQQADLKNLEQSFEESKQNQSSEMALDELNKSITTLKSQLDDKNSKADVFAKKLKQSMNSLYQQIMENFDDENTAFKAVHIKQIVSQKLKTATFTIIKEFEDDFRNSEASSSAPGGQAAPPVPQFE